MKILFSLLTFFLIPVSLLFSQTNYNQIIDTGFYYKTQAALKMQDSYWIASDYSDTTEWDMHHGHLQRFDKDFRLLNECDLPFTFKYTGCMTNSAAGGVVIVCNYPTHDSVSLMELDSNFLKKRETIISKGLNQRIFLHQVISLREGGYAAVGSMNNHYPGSAGIPDSLFLIRLNDNLEIVADSKIPFTELVIRDAKLVETSDGGFAMSVVFEFVFVFNGNSYDQQSRLIKTNPAGQVEWYKRAGGYFRQNQPVYLAATNDHSILQGYSYTDYIDWDYTEVNRITVQKFHEASYSLWTLQLAPSVNNYNTYVGDIICDDNGSVYCCGIQDPAVNKGWMFKTNLNGDSIWYREYDSPLQDLGQRDSYQGFDRLLKIGPNELLLFGFHWLKQNGYSWVIRTDTLGNFDTTYSIQEIHRPEMLQTFPNPCHSQFRITLPDAYPVQDAGGLLRLCIIDPTGRIVQSMECDASRKYVDINCSGWAKGIYLVRVEDSCHTIGMARIIKQ